jgi:glycosyltransferase involved in cell wall biosynthesis
MKKPFDISIAKGVLFVMPRNSAAWNGAEAMWITVAGWASSAKDFFGNAWVITSDTLATPEEIATYPLVTSKDRNKRSEGKRFIPEVLKTFLKDIILWKNRNRKTYADAPWLEHNIAFVWEHHDLFSGPGWKIAKKLSVPFVKYVHAPVIWEASKWGVKRPLWGKFLESFFEKPSLIKADIVACVSDQVAKKLLDMGIHESKIVISPMAVDPKRFTNISPKQDLKKRLGLENKLVVGWIGSFRSFHGLDKLVKVFCEAQRKKSDLALLLIGDGAEQMAIRKLAMELGITESVIFTGKIPFAEIPYYVQLFDIAIVSANNNDDFHYSPLKLREYLAAKKPTLAPNAGEIPIMFEDNEEILLYNIGNEDDLLTKLRLLSEDKDLRERLGEKGFKKIMEKGTWNVELMKVLTKLQANARI